MTADIATLGLRVDAREVREGDRALDSLERTGRRTDQTADRLNATMARMAKAMAAVTAALGVRELIRMADAWTSLEGRLSLVTTSAENLLSVQNKLFDMAQRTRSQLEGTADLYAKLTRSTQGLGSTEAQRLRVTESISKTMIIANASTEEQAGAIRQLGQAMASGVLRGDELNTVMEAAPRLAEAIAAGMGQTVGQIRAMAAEGKITSEAMINALLTQSQAIDTEFARVPKTVAQGVTQIENSLLRAVGVFDQANKLSGSFANQLTFVAENIHLVIGAATGLVAVGLLGWLNSATRAVMGKIAATTAAIAAERAAAAASLASATAQVAETGATATVTAARLAEARATTLAASGNLQLLLAVNGLIPAQGRAAAASAAHTVALNAQAAAAARVAGVAGFASRALAFMGGPVGAVIGVLSLGAAAWAAWGTKTKEATAEAEKTVSEKTAEIIDSLDKQIVKLNERNRLMKLAPEVAKGTSAGAQGQADILTEMNRVSKDATLNDIARAEILKGLGGRYNELAIKMEKAAAAQAAFDANDGASKRASWMTKNTKFMDDAGKLAAAIADAKKELGAAFNGDVEKMIRDDFARADNKKASDKILAQAKESKEYVAALQQERDEIGRTTSEVTMLAAARAAAAARPQDRVAIMLTASNLTIEREANERLTEQKKTSLALEQSLFAASQQQITSARDRVTAAQMEIETYGMGAAAITRLTLAKLQARQVALETNEGSASEIAANQALIASTEKLLGLQNKKADLDALFDTTKAESFGDALRDAFGSAGTALGKLTDLMQEFSDHGAANDKARAAAKLKYAGDDARTAKALSKIDDLAERDKIRSFANMAGAAKGFFKQHTAGYKVLEGVEKSYRALEMAMTLETMYRKIFATEAVTAAKLGAISTETAANVASVAPNVAADGTKATASGIAAFAKTLASLPFPFNVAAGAAVLALLVGAGVSMAGGGGGSASRVSVSEERQKKAGTGTVLGDDLAKSESLTKALEHLEDNSSMALTHSSRMLATLRSINQGIAGMASFVARAAGISGTAADQKLLGVGSSKGALGFSKSSTELTDQGIAFDPSQNVGSIMSGGVQASKFSELLKQKSSWWGLSKSSSTETQVASLEEELARQITLTVSDLYAGVVAAADALGVKGDDLEAQLAAVTLGFDKISLKGLTGEEIEKQLQAVFGSFGDRLAQIAAPGLADFQRVGEGYFETMVRLASDVDAATFELERFGLQAVALSDIVAKQGDVGAEIVRQSVERAETFGGALSGVGQIMHTLSGGASDLAASYGELKAAQDTMREVGIEADTLDRALIRGAGGLDALQAGLAAYFDTLSESEQLAAKTETMRLKFKALGLEMPDSVAGFDDLIRGIPRTTEAGRLLLGGVLNLAAGFAELHEATKALSAADLVENYATAGRDVQDALRSVGDTVQGFADRMKETAKGVTSARNAISEAFFSQEDKVTEARKKVDDLTAQSTKQTIAFGESMRDLIASMDADKLDPAGNLRTLREQFSANARLAQGGDKKAQDGISALVEKLRTAEHARARTGVEAAQADARIRSTLAALAASAEGAAVGTESPADVAARELKEAQDKLVDYAKLAAVTGASTDRAAQVTAGSTSGLLAAFQAATAADNAAQADYAAALALTSGLSLTVSNSLSGLLSGLVTLGEAQGEFLKARDDLAQYIIDTEIKTGNLDLFAANLAATLGLTGDAAEAFKTSLTDSVTGTATLAEALGSGAVKVEGVFNGIQGALPAVIEALAGTGAQAAMLAVLLGPMVLSTAARTLSDNLGLAGTAAAAFAAAMAAQSAATGAATQQATNMAIGGLYQSVLGRAPDAAGADFWAGQITSGALPFSEAARALAESAAANSAAGQPGYTAATGAADAAGGAAWLRAHNIPGYATGGYFGGGLRLVGEDGPEIEATGEARIWSHSKTRAMLQGGGRSAGDESEAGGGNTAALEAAVATLTIEVAKLRAAGDRTAAATEGAHRVLRKVTRDGPRLYTKEDPQ